MVAAFFIRLIRNQRGTSAIEMGLICGLIVLVMFSALQSFADESKAMWGNVSDKVSSSNKAARGG